MITPQPYDPLVMDKYMALITHMPQGFCIIEVLFDQTDQPIDYRFVEVNPAFEQQTGLQQAPGKRASELMTDNESYWLEAYGQVVRTGQPLQQINYNQSTQRWYTVSAARVGPAGSPLIAALVEDITERRAQDRRHEFLLKLSDAIRPIVDPVEVLRTAMDQVAEHFGVDSAVYHELDTTGEKVVLREGRTNDRIAMPTLWRLRDFGFYDDLTAGRTIYYEDTETDPRLQASLGSYRATRIRSGVGGTLMKRGRLVAMLGITHSEPRRWTDSDLRLIEEVAERTWDAVERARAEEALRREDRRKDEFMAMLGHELRNPLGVLSNTLVYLAMTQGRDEGLSYPMGIQRMSGQMLHLNRMVDDLLDISRIRQGKIRLQRQPIDLGPLLQQTLEAAQSLFEERSQSVDLALPLSPLVVNGDATRLAQVVMNLLTNAAKYTPEGGHVWISLDEQSGQAVLTVRDNGMGIPAQELTAIFEVFVQGDTSLDRPHGGLGLGLAVVKQLVDGHQGHIDAQSAGPGQGSTFRLTLPILMDKQPRPAPAPSPVRGDAVRVLLVDDNQELIDLMGKIMQLQGYEVHLRYSGPDGIAAAEALAPDVMLVDIGMPYMDGYAVCQQIRREAWGERLPMIALTGFGQEADKQRSWAAGFDSHLLKPVDYTSLGAVLTKTIAAKKADQRD